MTVAKTEYGNVIGGFTKLPWTKNNVWQRDTDAFLFSVTNSEKFNCLKPNHSLYHGGNSGPIFGQGHDFKICDKANENR